ncbi:PQQ-binding-like beta-propeller repeat protein [Streptomyces sp. NPDC057654]|uniref:outer membrane protein assembly factor BamB family protein n=1 Tax=Streptomyces sp. NPDC057654 TaxID=3346196 RepID=UPI0036B5E2D6
MEARRSPHGTGTGIGTSTSTGTSTGTGTGPGPLVRELITLEAQAKEVWARAGRRTTRAALAKRSGVSEQTLSDWFNGRHHPRDLDQLMKVVHVLAGWAGRSDVPYQPWARLLEATPPPRPVAAQPPVPDEDVPYEGELSDRTAAWLTRRNFLTNAVTATAAVGTGVAGWRVLDVQDVAPGQKRWRAATGGPVSSDPAVAKGVVYFGSDDQHIYAVRTSTGKPVWRQPFSTGGRARSSPVAAEGVVYAGSDDGKLYAIDARSGKQRWERPLNAALGWSSPVLAGDSVYVSSGNDTERRTLYRVGAAHGEERWKCPISDRPVWGPAVADGAAYVGCDDGFLYCVDAARGKLLWKFRGDEGKAFWRPAVAGGTVYVGSSDGKLYAIDPKSRKALWSSPLATEQPVGSTPLVVGSTVYVGSDERRVYAVAVSNGRMLWKADTDGVIRTRPTVAKGTVYVSSLDGYLYAFRAADGTVRWKSGRLGGALWSSPVVADGSVYVGSDDKNVYAVTA